MLSRYSILPVALIGLGGAQLASAGTYDEGQWVTSFLAGSQLIPDESITTHVSSNVGDLGITELDRMTGKDAFRSGPSFSVETGYMIQSDLEPFVRLSYSRLDGRNARIGAVSSPDMDSAAAIRGDFDDMKSWGLNVGTRWFVSDNGTFRTYLAGYLGAERTDAMRANLSVGGVPVSRDEFLPRSTRFDVGVEGGVAWQISNQADLGLSIGAQYVDGRKEVSNAFAPLGIDQVRFEDPHWSLPVNLAVNFHF